MIPGDGKPNDRLRVLLVDDNEAFRDVLSMQIERLGYEVQATSDAGEFLGTLSMAAQTFDLLVVDIRMPGLTGDKIISWIGESEEERLRTLPILIATGFPGDLPEELLTSRPSIRLLEKPFSREALENAIRQVTHKTPVH